MGPIGASGMTDIKIVAKPAELKAKLVIELYSDGRVAGSFPSDRVVAYGMLGVAHEILTAMNIDKMTKSQIVTPIVPPLKM